MGAKSTAIVQLASGKTAASAIQVLLPPKAKSVALTPEIFALVMLSVAFPVLVKIEVLGAVVAPCATLPKLSDVCDNVTSPEAPVPVQC